MKKIGAAWNKISSKDKDKYEKMAVADKVRVATSLHHL